MTEPEDIEITVTMYKVRKNLLIDSKTDLAILSVFLFFIFSVKIVQTVT